MKHSFRFSGSHPRPSWWPENEPWPPVRPRWRMGRGRFFRRLGCLLFGLIMLGALFMALVTFLVINFLGLADTFRHSAPWSILATMLSILFGFGLLAWAVRGVRHFSTPFGDLLDASGHVADGDYSVRVVEQGPREMRSLANAFNIMAARLQSHDRQRRDLLADVTHELRTPLTVLQGNLEGMLDGVYPADETQLKLLLDETNILSRLVGDLRTLALAEGGSLELRKEVVDPALLIRETLSAFHTQALALGVRLDFQGREGLALNIDPERIRQVLSNLIGNALRYVPRGGSVSVRCDVAGPPSDNSCAFTVSDTGPGVSEENLVHIFERFHKSSDSGGMGLGLSIAKSLVEAHGGQIEAQSQAGQGMSIRFTLPGLEWE